MSDSHAPLRATFLVSAARLDQCPDDDLPEVAFVGRSNAGKSSVLNRLAGQHALARVSRTPGRTQLINFFSVPAGGRLVDLPGYGYAEAPHAVRERWQRELDRYLNTRSNLVGLVLVADIRHPLKELDLALAQWSAELTLPLLVLLNKCDKLRSGAQHTALLQGGKALANCTLAQVRIFSARDGDGLHEVAAIVRKWIRKV